MSGLVEVKRTDFQQCMQGINEHKIIYLMSIRTEEGTTVILIVYLNTITLTSTLKGILNQLYHCITQYWVKVYRADEINSEIGLPKHILGLS